MAQWQRGKFAISPFKRWEPPHLHQQHWCRGSYALRRFSWSVSWYGKQASYFAHAAYIHSSLDVIFNELCSDKRLTSTDKTTFVKAITYYHAEINAVHPFREGNGRVLRTFLRLMAEQLGWDIDWSDLDPDQNIEAAAQAMFHEPKLLYDIIFNRTSRSL